MLLVDSLSYPITEHHLAGDASVEFEPRSVVRRSDANTGLFVSELSSLLSLLAPNEVSSLRLAVAGRLDYESQGLSRIPEDHSAFWGVETRIRYEEQSENVRLLSNEIAGADQSSISKLSSTLDEASFATRSTTAGVAVHYSPGDERSSIHNLIRLSGNARLLNYDTPSDLNDDDHDELVTSLEAHYDRVFSDALTFSVGVTASRTHLVYLKSDRSAQNNVTQSLALTTEATYSRPEIITHVRGEVFANYTVLDYLNILPSLQEVGNYVLRGASLSDSILFSLGIHPSATLGPITFEEGMSLRLSERGNFNADAFTERRDTRMAEIGATALFGISSQTGLAPWSIRVGARGFVLSTSGRSANNPTPASAFGELERQTRIGPMVQISLLRWASVDERSSTFEPVLSASAWYAVIKSETFDVPSVTRTPQLESHLQVQWTF